MAHNEYCMFKGKLDAAAPFFDTYIGNPHYVITVIGGDQKPFNIVVNSASDQNGEDGNNRVYYYADLNFVDPIVDKLKGLDLGLHIDDFPLLDYWQDRSLLDLRRMRSVPYKDADGSRFDINDIVDGLLTIDETTAAELRPYSGGRPESQDRKFWKPTRQDVIVYGFGFLFLPAEDGLHETHMNQGNPKNGRHAKENGAFHDGAVIVQKGDDFAAIFTAFQTQYLPTDATGFPTANAAPLPDFIRNG